MEKYAKKRGKPGSCECLARGQRDPHMFTEAVPPGGPQKAKSLE